LRLKDKAIINSIPADRKIDVDSKGDHMLRIAVCDDVSAYVAVLADWIKAWGWQRNFNVEAKRFATREEMLFDQEDAGDFAAVFINANPIGEDSLKTAVKIREQNQLVSIVFVMHHGQDLKQASRIFPFHYIEKPLSQKKVFEALDQVVWEHKNFFESFTFRFKRITFNIPLGETLYFVSEGRKIRVLSERAREYTFYQKMDVLEEILSACNNRFVRIHQSYLINWEKVEQYRTGEVIMRNGELLPISRSRRRTIARASRNLLALK